MCKSFFKKIMKSNLTGVIISNLIIFTILSFLGSGFLTEYNFQSLSKTASVTIIVGIGQMLALSIGQFNIALGAMGCCSAMLAGFVMEELGLSPVYAIVAGVALATVLGYIQGFLIVKTKISPFIVTLSLMSIYNGAATGLTNAAVYDRIPDEFKNVSTLTVFSIPVLFIISMVVIVIFYLFYNRTYMGRQILATGASQKAAYYAGVNVNKITITVHTLSGLCAGIAGIMTAMRHGAAQMIIGEDWMLLSCAATVLGGTLLSGGKVAIVGTIFGAFLMTMINTGLVLMNLNYYWFSAFVGGILIVIFEINRSRETSLTRIDKRQIAMSKK